MNRATAFESVAVALGLGLFLVLKTYTVWPTVTDDWIYAYMARRVGEGAWPYRDFFFAHPPLHLLALTAALKLFGFTLAGVRIAPALATALTGFFLHRIARRLAGRTAGVIALFAFLFALDVLRSSTHITGVNLSLLLVTVGGWLLLRRQWIGAGLAFAGGGLTALYVLPLVAVAVALRFLRERRGALVAAVTFAVAWFGVQALVAAPAPGAYVRQVYTYHQLKQENPERSEETWKRALAYHAVGTSAIPIALLGLGAAWWTRPRARSRKRGDPEPERSNDGLRASLLVVLSLTASYIAFLASLKELYAYYLLPLHALAALLVALGSIALLRAGRVLWAGGQRGRAGVLAAGLLATLVLTDILRTEETQLFRRGTRATHRWTGGSLSGPLDDCVRALLWKGERRIGDFTCPITRYLWHEASSFRSADALVSALRAEMRPGDCIFGDSRLAPLLALQTGLRIARDEADTNTKRFNSGASSIDELLARIDSPELRWIVVVPGSYIDRVAGFRAWREARFETAFEVSDPDEGTILLARRRS